MICCTYPFSRSVPRPPTTAGLCYHLQPWVFLQQKTCQLPTAALLNDFIAMIPGETLFPAAKANSDTNSAAANELLLVITAVVKSLLDLSYHMGHCRDHELPLTEEVFHALCGESEGSIKMEQRVRREHQHDFDVVYSRLEEFLDGQIDEIKSLVSLFCDCLVSDPGGAQLTSEMLEGAPPDVSAIGDGGTLLGIVGCCLVNSNNALMSVVSRIRPAATAAPGASLTVAPQDVQADIMLVCMFL